MIRFKDGSKLFFFFSNLRGEYTSMNGQTYYHPQIQFIIQHPYSKHDSSKEDLHGRNFLTFEFQSNGRTHDWYGASIKGLTMVNHPNEIEPVIKVLNAWAKFLKERDWEKATTNKRDMMRFLRKHNIKRVYPTDRGFNSWVFDPRSL